MNAELLLGLAKTRSFPRLPIEKSSMQWPPK
jgi:hypothetical protein